MALIAFAAAALLQGALEPALVLASSDFGDFIGYTIVAKKTVAGYVDNDGKKSDSFEGCEYGRAIVFDDDTYVRCQSYGYQYAYRPEAVILVNGQSAKMVVDNEEYDVSLR